MTDKAIIRLVADTFTKYGIKSVREPEIIHVIRALGYDVYFFGPASEDEQAQALLERESLVEYASAHESFSVKTKATKAVFVKDGAMEDERLYLLCKELGRILTARSVGGLLGVCVDDEKTAACFASHVCAVPEHGTLYNFFKFHTVEFTLLAAIAYAAVILAGAYVFFDVYGLHRPQAESAYTLETVSSPAVSRTAIPAAAVIPTAPAAVDSLPPAKSEPPDAESGEVLTLIPSEETPETSETAVPDRSAPQNAEEMTQTVSPVKTATPSGYYATGSGKKYHTAGCSYITGSKSGVVSVSLEDIQSGKYTPCSRCIK